MLKAKKRKVKNFRNEEEFFDIDEFDEYEEENYL
jgi:hypothetical protein